MAWFAFVWLRDWWACQIICARWFGHIGVHWTWSSVELAPSILFHYRRERNIIHWTMDTKYLVWSLFRLHPATKLDIRETQHYRDSERWVFLNFLNSFRLLCVFFSSSTLLSSFLPAHFGSMQSDISRKTATQQIKTFPWRDRTKPIHANTEYGWHALSKRFHMPCLYKLKTTL